MSTRTKGNVKPSNSERASRLLKNKFLSFSEASKTLSPVYGTKQNESVSAFDWDIGSDFQNIFKHMTKKDINTKVKALEDFMVLCKTKDENELIKICQYWFRIYRKLANSIEWNIRNLAHMAQYQFISSFNRDLILKYLDSSLSTTSNKINEISFKTLITMPAIMWNSCFDSYTQPFQSARRVFKHLYPSQETVNFLLNNHEPILNYSLYIIFNEIPIELFYSSTLPADSVKMFEEHQLSSCLLGLSSLINELLCFYLKCSKENSSDNLRSKNAFECLEKIFLRLNTEFIKSKSLDDFTIQQQQVEMEKVEDISELKLSNKERRKLKKVKNDLKKEHKSCKNSQILNCLFSENSYVRIAFFQTLNSLIRLTSFFSDPHNKGDMSCFDQLNISTQLWFKLYKSYFFEAIFKGFVDPTIEIRGLSWVIGSHLLRYSKIYNPWSVINCDEWLEKTLQPFILNGMKISGSIVDFGISRIGIKTYKPLFQEFHKIDFQEHFSALKIIRPNHELIEDFEEKIDLIFIFIEFFNKNYKSKYKIFTLFLNNLLDAFENVLFTDMLLLIELYLNLCYFAMRQCFESFTEENNEETKTMIISITKQVHQLLKITLVGEKSELFLKSQVYLNHLLMVHHTKLYYSYLCKSESKFNVGILNDYYRLFESQLIIAYRDLLSNFYSNHQLSVMRFLSESFFQPDHYFSYDYYYTKADLNYEKNLMKILRRNLIEMNIHQTKCVTFGEQNSNDVSIKKISQTKHLFDCFIENEEYTTEYQDQTISLSLTNIMSSFTEHFISIIVDLVSLLDSMFEQTFTKNLKDFEEFFKRVYLLLAHLQYELRFVSDEDITKMNGLITPRSSLKEHCLHWILNIYLFCKDFSDNEDLKYRYMVLIGTKLIDIYLVVFSKCCDHSLMIFHIQEQFVSKLNAFAFCISVRHLQKISNISGQYEKIVKEFNNAIQQYSTLECQLYNSLITLQIEIVFSEERNKAFESLILIELINFVTMREQIDDTTFKIISKLLNELFDNFSKIDNEQLVRHNFYVNFPILIKDLYHIVLKHPNKLFLIENFQKYFTEHINSILEKFFSLLSWNFDKLSTIQISNAIEFFKNSQEFLISSFSDMFDNYDYFSNLIAEQSAIQFSFIIENFIFHNITFQFDHSNRTKYAIEIIHAFLCLLTSKNKILTTSKGYSFQNVESSLRIIFRISDQLKEKFEDRSYVFEKNNDFTHLYTLYFQDNLINQIYEFIHFPKQDPEYQKRFHLTSNNFMDNIQFLEMNTLIISIVDVLFRDIYFDSYYGNLIEENATIDILRHQSDIDYNRSSILVVFKQLFKNFYLLENFALLLKHFDSAKLSHLLSNGTLQMEKSEYEAIRMRFDDLFKQFESILNPLVWKFAKELSNSTRHDLLLDFLWFLNSSKTKEVNLPFFIRCIECYFKGFINWNKISKLEKNKNCLMELSWISLINTNCIDTIIDSIHKVVEPITNVEIEENEVIVKSFQSFTELLPETVYKFLLILNVSLHKSSQIENLKTNLIEIVRQLSRSNFCNLFQMTQLPDISKMEYQICWMTSHLLAQSVSMINSFGLEEFQMFIFIYKQWIQMIFTLPEEMPFDSIMISTQILQSLQTFIQSCQTWLKRDGQKESNFSPEIIECLKNFFAYNSNNMLLPLFVTMSDSFENNPLHSRFLQKLSNVLISIDVDCLQDIAMLELNQSLLMYNEDSVVEQRFRLLMDQVVPSPSLNYLQTGNGYYDFILEHVTPMLLKDDYDTIFCAYHLICTAVHSADWRAPTSTNFNESNRATTINSSNLNYLTLSCNDNNDDKDHSYPPKIFVCLFENLFKSISIEDLNSQVAFAYLLVWTIYLRLLTRFPYKETESEIRFDLINFLIEKNLHIQLFDNLFFLLYNSLDSDLDDGYFEKVIQSILKDQQIKDVVSKLDCLHDSPKLLDFMGQDHMRIARLAFFVYYQALCHIPNVVRSWFNTLKHTQKELVDNVTRRYFTKMLVEKELDNITMMDHNQFGNIKIKFSKKSNEISAIYSLKEISFGIKFDFKVNYPLTAISIECFNKSGVNEDVCRKWLQRLTIFFNKMNCSILDGIIMIKPNMDKFFEGIEECMICLFALYGVNGQFPRFKCPQCKKKFHTTCIRKWFQIHHSPICPQCKFEFQ